MTEKEQQGQPEEEKKELDLSNYEDKQFTNVKVTGKEVVVQSNALIDSFKRIKLRELKLFSFLISKVNPQKPNDMRFRITIKELAKAIGVESTESIYRDVRFIVKNLMGKVITIYGQENGQRTVTDIPLLSYSKYWVEEGYADVEISPYLAPYIINLHREFTQYKLSNIICLSSSYAIRIYEMLKKQETIGSRTFYIDELKKILGLSKKFEKFKDFRVRVLDIAQREINQKTDLEVSYTPKKAGKKVVAIEFDIKKKEQTESTKVAYINPNISSENVQKLMDFGFTIKDIMNMLDYLTNAEAAEAIAAAEEQIEKGKTRNKKALIRTALREKWIRSVKPEEEKTACRKVVNSHENYDIMNEQSMHMKFVKELTDKFTSFFKNLK